MSTTPVVHTLESQVGGHAGVMATEDGSLVIKPALTQELAFYQRIQSDPAEAFVALKKYTPTFMGTLTLEGEAAGSIEEGTLQIKPLGERKDECMLARFPGLVEGL